MILKDISLKLPQENILYDDVLLYLAEEGKASEVLRFWESEDYFVVLGRISKEQEDINLREVSQDGIAVLRRSSGGGTVLQGKGCLNYSLVLSKERGPDISDLRGSYQFILNKIISALGQLGVEAEYHPISDIALKEDQKKISGNAQKRSRKFILHHGTILYDFDLECIEKYLKIPKDIPPYRWDRSHLDFIANIPIAIDDIKNEIEKIFQVNKREKNIKRPGTGKFTVIFKRKRRFYYSFWHKQVKLDILEGSGSAPTPHPGLTFLKILDEVRTNSSFL